MGYTTNSGPFWVGSLVFIILGVAACCGSQFLAKAGRNPHLGWGMAWLMQWHPLIYPIREVPSAA